MITKLTEKKQFFLKFLAKKKSALKKRDQKKKEAFSGR